MPFELPDEPLEEAARRAAEIFVEIFRGLQERPVSAPERAAELEGRLAGTLTDSGVGMLAALEEFRSGLLPAAMGTPHPLYMGLVNSSPLPGAALADLLISSLNNNGAAFEQAPPAYQAETEVIRAFCDLFGYGAEGAGLLLPGGTFAILHGLLLARQLRFPAWGTHGPGTLLPIEVTEEGFPVHGPAQPKIYASRAVHFSVQRAAHAMGVGRAHVVPVQTDARGAMDVDQLRLAIEYDEASQAETVPLAVIATAGTTSTGAIDPIAAIADLCRERRIWLHVDACYGGAALLLDELRERFAGIERADSISVDPHKWFFTPMVAGLVLTRHPDLEKAAFDVEASYVPPQPHVDRWRTGLPTSRRAMGLAVWMGLRAHGWSAVRDAVRRDIALSRTLERKLGDAGFEVLPDGELSIVCARWVPDDMADEDVDALQARIARRVVATGQAWFATVEHGGCRWLRFNIVNLHTREHHLDTLVELLGSAVVAEAAISG